MAKKPIKRVRLDQDPLPFPVSSAPHGDDTRHDGVDGLSKIEERFCWRYVSHYEPARAAIEAGYSPTSAHITGPKLRDTPRIKAKIREFEEDLIKRNKFDGDAFLARELLLASADVSELIETWIPPCRYCWGINHEYQRTHAEYHEDWETWLRLPDKAEKHTVRVSAEGLLLYVGGNKVPFDQRGGDGYDPQQPPNPACPNCRGRGNEDPEEGTKPYIRLKDSRDLSPTARLLFAGVERTSRGLKQLMQSQDAARARLSNLSLKYLELKRASDDPDANLFGLKSAQSSGDSALRITRVERVIIQAPQRRDDDTANPDG